MWKQGKKAFRWVIWSDMQQIITTDVHWAGLTLSFVWHDQTGPSYNWCFPVDFSCFYYWPIHKFLKKFIHHVRLWEHLDTRWSYFECAGYFPWSGLSVLMKRAFKFKDPFILKMLRNISQHDELEIKMKFVVSENLPYLYFSHPVSAAGTVLLSSAVGLICLHHRLDYKALHQEQL